MASLKVLDCTYRVIGTLSCISYKRSYLGHRFDSNDTLDSKVGLIGQMSSEIIGAKLISRDERIRDQELGPLVKEGILSMQNE